MSQLTDQLLTALAALIRTGGNTLASDVRAFETMMIGAIGTLETRARGNRFIYAAGPPPTTDALEGDLGINTSNGDVFQYTGGQFTFLFNLLPRGVFDPFEAPVSLRDWAADAGRAWFGPSGGEAIYCQDALPAGAVAGMSWDDPDTNVSYDIRPVAFANATVIVLRRNALLAA